MTKLVVGFWSGPVSDKIKTTDFSTDECIGEFINRNELLGCFGQAGLQRKKPSNCHK
jgi:hypothetical protein